MLNLLWKCFYAIGLIFIVTNRQLRKMNAAIWSRKLIGVLLNMKQREKTILLSAPPPLRLPPFFLSFFYGVCMLLTFGHGFELEQGLGGVARGGLSLLRLKSIR